MDGVNAFAVFGLPSVSPVYLLPADGKVGCIPEYSFPNWTLPYANVGVGASSACTQTGTQKLTKKPKFPFLAHTLARVFGHLHS